MQVLDIVKLKSSIALYQNVKSKTSWSLQRYNQLFRKNQVAVSEQRNFINFIFPIIDAIFKNSINTSVPSTKTRKTDVY